MGSCSARPLIPEPPTGPHDPTAPSAVLVERGSPNALIFQHANAFAGGAATTVQQTALPLTCSHPPGAALVQKDGQPRGPYNVDGVSWSVHDVVVGSAGDAATVTFENGFVQRTTDDRVLMVSEWKYEPYQTIELGRDRYDDAPRTTGKTRTGHGKQGGRAWVFNVDGTLSPAEATHLVIGFALPDATLVNRTSPARCVFEHAQALAAGAAVPLTLVSHPGLSLCPKFNPQRIDKWHVSFQQIGVGRASRVDDALCAALEDGCFLVSKHASSPGFVLDVPFDMRKDGTGDMPLAVIKMENKETKEHKNKARLWTINADGTIAPTHSQHLVLGVRPGYERAFALLSSLSVAAPAQPPGAAIPLALPVEAGQIQAGQVVGMTTPTPAVVPATAVVPVQMVQETATVLGPPPDYDKM